MDCEILDWILVMVGIIKVFTGSCFVPQQEAGVWDGTEPLGRGAHLEVGNWELTFESYSLALTQTLCICEELPP